MSTKARTRPTAAFIGALGFAAILYFAMCAIQPHLPHVLFDYNTWFEREADSVLYRILWLLGDATEPHFQKTLLGGIGVLAGSVIAYLLAKAKSPLAGTTICYSSGKWPYVLLASMLSLALSVFLYGGLRFEGDAWIPTFVPYVCVAGAVVLLYGCTAASVLTGAVLGALLTTPVTMFMREVICLPAGLPGVIASVSGMWIGGIIAFELCHILPWMKPVDYTTPHSGLLAPPPTAEEKSAHPNRFFLRRMLADYSEPMFVGNEIAGGMLVLGSMLSWILNPDHPFYGTGWFPALITCQIITGAVALYAYWPHWIEGDFFPSFVPVVSVAPAMVLTFGASPFIIVFSAVLGGLMCPPVANMINDRIPAHWHGMVGFTFSMAFCSLSVGVLLRYILMAFPMLG